MPPIERALRMGNDNTLFNTVEQPARWRIRLRLAQKFSGLFAVERKHPYSRRPIAPTRPRPEIQGRKRFGIVKREKGVSAIVISQAVMQQRRAAFCRLWRDRRRGPEQRASEVIISAGQITCMENNVSRRYAAERCARSPRRSGLTAIRSKRQQQRCKAGRRRRSMTPQRHHIRL